MHVATVVAQVSRDFLEELRHIQTCPVFSYIEDEPRVVEQISGVQDWKKVKQGEIEYFWHVPTGRVSLRSPVESGEEMAAQVPTDLAGAVTADNEGKNSAGLNVPASSMIHNDIRQVTESIRSQALELSMNAGSKLLEMDEISRLAIQAATLSQVVDAVFEMFCSERSGKASKTEGMINFTDPWLVIGRVFKEEGEKIRQLAASTVEATPLVTGSGKDSDAQPAKMGAIESGTFDLKGKHEMTIEMDNAPPLPDEPEEPEAPPLPNEPFGVVERPPVLLHQKQEDVSSTIKSSASQKRAEKTPKASGKTKIRKREATLLKRWEAAKQEIEDDDDSQQNDDSGHHHKMAENADAAGWRQRALKAGHARLSEKNEISDQSHASLHNTTHSQVAPDLNLLSTNLPEDWQAMWDPSTGAVYYGNLKTKVRICIKHILLFGCTNIRLTCFLCCIQQETRWDRP